MKRVARIRALQRVLCALMAFVFTFGTAVGNVAPAFAVSESAEATVGQATSAAGANDQSSNPAPATESSPTVVRELEASRTAESSTYLLSDGSYRAEIFTAPIHFKDADGVWKDIDPSLVPTGAPGVYHTRASAYDQTVASEDVTDTPLIVRHGDWSVGMRLIGGEQSGMTAMGDTASYPLAMTDTALTYETGGNTTKDTLLLSSRDAPDTFTFFMGLDNLRVFADPTGGYTFYDSKNEPAGRIAPLLVFDSAVPSQEAEIGSVCTSATVEIVEADGGAYVTYRVPREWLDDPARVYPVKVDPETTWGGGSVSADTFVAANYPSSAYGADNYLYSGYATVSNGAPYTWQTVRTLLAFDLGSTIGQGATINGATLQLYCSKNDGASTVTANTITSSGWSGSSTWNSTFGNGTLTFVPGTGTESSPVVGTGYKFWNVTAPVQRWFNGSQGNLGLLLNESSDGSSGNIFRRYASSTGGDTTGQRPHLTVNFDPPSVGGQFLNGSGTGCGEFSSGEVVQAVVQASASIAEQMTSNVEMEVKGKTPSGASVSRGRFLWTPSNPGIGSYVTTQTAAGEWFSFDPNGSGYVADAVTPLLGSCRVISGSGSKTVVFTYQIGSAYGDVQDNELWAKTNWPPMTQQVDLQQSFGIRPGVPDVSAVTAASAEWFTEQDADGDGVNDTPNDGPNSGRGSVDMTW